MTDRQEYALMIAFQAKKRGYETREEIKRFGCEWASENDDHSFHDFIMDLEIRSSHSFRMFWGECKSKLDEITNNETT
jgi:hypothetical protein